VAVSSDGRPAASATTEIVDVPSWQRNLSSAFAWNATTGEKKSQWSQSASYTPDCGCLTPFLGTAGLPAWSWPQTCFKDPLCGHYWNPTTWNWGNYSYGCLGNIFGYDEWCIGGYTLPSTAGIAPSCAVWNSGELITKTVNASASTDAISINNIPSLKTTFIDPLLAPLNTLVSTTKTTLEGLESTLNSLTVPFIVGINKLTEVINELMSLGQGSVEDDIQEIQT